ncbi:hypothetical protein MH117_11165 [Paenibacillus sp. ACRRX]|uniref:hypothetical protein n=1 Tax=Paenibacillus sp. ACRRX TaxID=2918206 RepID=UPI001EF62EBD|nr:hypothetical protein [Paenibacillus sp. ACRRX]MCG7407981.1 hypothetical protein [Paenibacillus sp. ACRRX]
MSTAKVELYFQHEDELDQLYELLRGEARGEVQLSDSIRLLYEELHQQNQQIQDLIQHKQVLSKKMKEVSYDSYTQPSDSYFVDRKW